MSSLICIFLGFNRFFITVLFSCLFKNIFRNVLEFELRPSTFYNQKVVKKLLEDLRDREWQHELAHGGNYHSHSW